MRFGLYAITLAAAATSIGSLIYILGDPQQYSIFFRAKYLEHLTLVRAHGVFAALTLLLGPFQFLWPQGKAHRWRGYLYLVGIVIGGITGFLMGMMALGGYISQVGFCLMSMLWLYTGVQAFRAAKRRNFTQHKIWMIRNFALAFGAVTLRVYLYVGRHLRIDFETLYPTSVWVCWTPCLVVAEWIVAQRGTE